MAFTDELLEAFLPPYLQVDPKNRLKTYLSDFFNNPIHDRGDKYGDFYCLESPDDLLMQSDIVNSIKSIFWNFEITDYENIYTPAMLLSNTCDVIPENERTTNIKDALFAPVVPLTEFLEDLSNNFSKATVDGFYNSLKQQQHTNLFYLPANHKNGKEYMVFLDRAFSQPVVGFSDILGNVADNRFLSLSNWGFYLFLLKLSYHLCRLPETDEGRDKRGPEGNLQPQA